jgi:hypothetical protein
MGMGLPVTAAECSGTVHGVAPRSGSRCRYLRPTTTLGRQGSSVLTGFQGLRHRPDGRKGPFLTASSLPEVHARAFANVCPDKARRSSGLQRLECWLRLVIALHIAHHPGFSAPWPIRLGSKGRSRTWERVYMGTVELLESIPVQQL